MADKVIKRRATFAALIVLSSLIKKKKVNE